MTTQYLDDQKFLLGGLIFFLALFLGLFFRVMDVKDMEPILISIAFYGGGIAFS